MYAITGITGQVGGAVGRILLQAGLPVRAVVRDAAKGQAWQDAGCDVAIATMDDAIALTTAFRGAEAVFVLLPPVFDPAPGYPESRAVVDAVHAALLATPPQRVVALSTIGAQATQPNLLNQLGLMERALGTLDLPVAFLRPGWFMENSAWDVAPARDHGELPSFLQPTDRAIPMVATADVGRVAAELLQERWDGMRVVELSGPASVSPDDLAAAFSAALAHPVHAQPIPRSAWEARFRAMGMQHPLSRMQMLDGFNEGWIAFEGTHEQRRGAVTIDTVARGLVAQASAA